MRSARIVRVPLVTTTLPLKTTTWFSMSRRLGWSASTFSGLPRSPFSADASGSTSPQASKAAKVVAASRAKGRRMAA